MRRKIYQTSIYATKLGVINKKKRKKLWLFFVSKVQRIRDVARELCLQVLRREGHFTAEEAHRQQMRDFRGEA